VVLRSTRLSSNGERFGLLVANGVGAGAAAGFAGLGLVRPSYVEAGAASPELLTVAGLVQLGDSALGIRQRNASMTLAPAAMGLVHLASARVLRADQ